MKIVLPIIVGVLVLAADQLIKTLSPVTLVKNQNLLFGLEIFKNQWFWIFPSLILILIFIIIKTLHKVRVSFVLGLFLILAGAISNFADRLFRGGVLDYFHLGAWYFNLGDVAIIVGLGLICEELYVQSFKNKISRHI